MYWCRSIFLTYKAEQLGYHSQIILAGRRINDDMGKYVAENLIKSLIKADIPVKGAKVGILGFTFKDNCPDTRNTRVIDIINELYEYDIKTVICNPVADKNEAMLEYGLKFIDIENFKGLDAVIVAVAHDLFSNLSVHRMNAMYADIQRKVLIDVKGILNKRTFEESGYVYWRL